MGDTNFPLLDGTVDDWMDDHLEVFCAILLGESGGHSGQQSPTPPLQSLYE